MRVISHHTQPNGLRIETSEGTLQLIAYTTNVVRVRYTRKPSLSAQESLMITAQPVPEVAYAVQETSHMLIFTTSAIEIQIQKETAAFVYCDRQGHVLTREPEQGGKTLVPASAFRSLFDETTVRANVQSVDGARVKIESVKHVVDRQAYHARLEFVWSEGDTYNYENGAFATIGLHWDDAQKRLHIGKRQGAYAGMPLTRTFSLLLVSEQHGTGVDNSRIGSREVTYDGTPLIIEMSGEQE